jgi:hypothetical protein
MFVKRWLPVCALTMLAGCSVGMSGGSGLSGSFDAPVDYRRAYQSAHEQAETCLLGNGGYKIEGGLEASRRAGLVSVVPKLLGSGEMARVELSAIDDAHTRVNVSMWGEGIWDASAMRAMRDAVNFGVASCTTYMPVKRDPKAPNPDNWFTRK